MAPSSTSDRWLGLSIAALLGRWPAAAQLFFDHRMACVGCSFSRFDRLDEALAVHGLDPEGFLEGLAAIVDTDPRLAQGGAS